MISPQPLSSGHERSPFDHCLLSSLVRYRNQYLFDVFVGFLLSLALSIMAPPKFTRDPAFFGDPDGICGLEMAKLAGFSYGEVPTALLPLVVSRSLTDSCQGETSVRSACLQGYLEESRFFIPVSLRYPDHPSCPVGEGDT
jgi:hypothetical protein